VTQSGSVRVVIASNFPRDEKLGTSRTPLRLATELAKLGIDVSLIFAEDLTPVPAGRTDQLTAPFRMALTLAKRARQADVVDIAGFDGWPYAHFARRRRPGQAIVSRSNGLWFKALAAEGRWDTGTARGVASHLYQRLLLLQWERSSLCQSDVALFLSHDDRAEIVRRGWKSSEGVAVVNPAVDGFFTSPFPLEQRRNVAFVGTFFHRKGSDVVGQSMSRILRERPGLSLALFGTGMPAADVLAAFDPLVRPRVIVVEPLSPRELARRLGEFAVLLFPTRYEGFGIVVIEAMRAGLAVVTTPTGAGTDLIHDGENGLLIPIGSVDAAERAVARLVDDPSLRIRLANAAIADTRERSWERAAQETLAVYERARELAARRAFSRKGAV
jgi:glycosyltransferase involved in cell wall biosynthesis